MGRLRTISRLRAGGSGSADPDAAAWAAAVTANSGTYSGTTLAAVDTFTKAAKASGYWTKLNRINLFAGDQLAACLVPLKVGGGNATDTNVNFVAGDYSEATGLTGNGSTKRLRTGLIPSASLTLNDTHLAVYNRAANATGGQIGIGADDGVNFLQTYSPLSTGTFYSDQYNSSGSGGRVSGAVVAPYRLLVASRTAAAAHAIYKDGASVASSATSGGVLPAFELYVFAANSSGTANQFTAMPFGAYSIGAGLTAADVTAYNAHMQAFQQALGRQV